jgi:hypothetical protein
MATMQIQSSFQGGAEWDTANIDLLKKGHEKILRMTKDLVSQGNKVMIDYIIFGDFLNFIQSFQEETVGLILSSLSL